MRAGWNAVYGTWAAVAGCVCCGYGSAEPAAAPTYAQVAGVTVLDNSRVHVERYVIAPGQILKAHRDSDDELFIFTKGGQLTDSAGRAVWWGDGRVVWQARSRASNAEAGLRNSGGAAIELVGVRLKSVTAAADAVSKFHPLNYPNIAGEDLLDNAAVMVQRFVVAPGQWEGPHEHVPNMLYVHIKGGQWAARSRHEPVHAYPEPTADGKVGWMTPVALAEEHESGNIGQAPIDLIWVTLKK